MNKKKFGFWSVVLLTINSIIGTGIFLSPQSVVIQAGRYTPLVYVGAALFAGILAMTFASAAKYVTKNGAAYAYTKAAFGDNTGLYVGITRFVSAAIAWGVMGTAVVRSTLNIFVGPDAIELWMVTVGFVILMVVLLVINLLGNQIVRFMNNVSTIGKVLALAVVVLAGVFILLTTGVNHFNEVEALIPTVGMNFSLFVSAVIAAFYAFTGFESVASAASEMEKPEKILPKAIPLGMLIIGLIYIGVIGMAMMLNPRALIESQEIVVLAAVFENQIIRSIIIIGALISMFGINIAASFSTPRLFQALATEKQVPEFLGKENRNGIPVLSFIITALFAIAIPMAFNYDMRGIMVISSISRFVQFMTVPVAVLAFYYGQAVNKQDVIKTASKNFFTDVMIPVLAFAMTVVLLINFDWVQEFSVYAEPGIRELNMYAIGAMILGYIIFPLLFYFYNRNRQSKPKPKKAR